jgi:hypothetical protein
MVVNDHAGTPLGVFPLCLSIHCCTIHHRCCYKYLEVSLRCLQPSCLQQLCFLHQSSLLHLQCLCIHCLIGSNLQQLHLWR